MIFGINLVQFIEYVGVFGVAFIIFAESGLLIGFFLPGDSLLFTAGFLTHAGLLPINLFALICIVFIAAVLGDSVGYAFGKKVGPSLFSRPNSRLFKADHLKKAEAFYEKYGTRTIIFARFIPVVRTFAPIVAGVSAMKYKTFVTFNIIGGFLWSAAVTSLGFFVGSQFEKMGIPIDRILLPTILIIIFISVLPPIISVLRNKERRRLLWAGSKRQLAMIFKRK